MLRTLKTIFLVAVITIMAYWLLVIGDDVRRAGALAMHHLRDGGLLGMLLYLAVAEMRR